ncbi:MAG: methyltransferase [Chitinophagaceae bacterium]|nr:MAG: methyltransferase [Chitinophagaceae bacterium]
MAKDEPFFVICSVLQRIYHYVSGLLARKNLYLTKGLEYLGRAPRFPLHRLDYVRVATLELLAQELERAEGAVAELGVYQGGFAKYIAQAFPSRRFYLFDTFTGFDARDVQREQEGGFGAGAQSFADTSVAQVLQQLQGPERCVVRKGFFPETFAGLEEERFCFLSLDADLYEPIRAGLEHFYPRLVPGGAIMVHDFNNQEYPGCRKALEEYCLAAGVAFVPIPDIGGSVVLRKPLA